MNKNSTRHFLLVHLLLLVAMVFLFSCSKDEEDPGPQQPSDPCENGPEELEISDFLHAFTGESTGRVQVTATGGNGDLSYSIDGENFSESNEITGLAAGEYTITVRDDSLCTATLEYEVKEFPEVSFSDTILPLINANCQVSGCHGSNPSLPSWSGYDNIKANAARIRSMVTQKFMPPPSSGNSLSDAQIADIQNWVDVGAPNN